MDTVKIDKKHVKLVAHRGLSGIETENTCASFVAGCNHSYYAIETDVHVTKDGKYVLNHDENFKRVAGVDKVIADSTLNELQEIVLFDKDGTKNRKDLRPATLQNYLSICKKYEKSSVVELKSDFTDAQIAEIIDIIKSYDHLDKVSFISFNYENLLKVRKILPNHSAQYLFWGFTDEIFEMLVRDKIDADVHYPSLLKEDIERAHSLGITVNCWTIDSPEDAERYISYGIDFITTNILE